MRCLLHSISKIPNLFKELLIDPLCCQKGHLFCKECILEGLLAQKDIKRPLIFLDETHIKNKYKGCILVVVSKDANDDLFTIGYSVVDAENDANWE
ncbi:hypothetical protein ZIOFF_073911 [Zingiber officinale]|uniref:Uncharacterized protein n=1 Tax=Zingiber officinale TaxID=94328 RepID=A0A8J5BZC1_ZINOF|nr:hypothetical protein ZIOFF_073911 [Zingiber officinale]